MIHRRNLVLIAVAYAVAYLFLFAIPALRDSRALHGFYTGYFLLVALLTEWFSSNTHSPGAAALPAFIVYTVLYMAVVLAAYALVLEWRLLKEQRRDFDRLDHAALTKSSPRREGASVRDAGPPEPEEPAYSQYLQSFGAAAQRLERKRRRHWLLRDDADIALDKAPEETAARLLQSRSRSSAKLLRELKASVHHQAGAASAEGVVSALTRRSAAVPRSSTSD